MSLCHKQTSHSGITGLCSDVIIICGKQTDTGTTDTDCHLFSVMLEPKSLAQLVMKQIYQYRKELPWKSIFSVDLQNDGN